MIVLYDLKGAKKMTPDPFKNPSEDLQSLVPLSPVPEYTEEELNKIGIVAQYKKSTYYDFERAKRHGILQMYMALLYAQGAHIINRGLVNEAFTLGSTNTDSGDNSTDLVPTMTLAQSGIAQKCHLLLSKMSQKEAHKSDEKNVLQAAFIAKIALMHMAPERIAMLYENLSKTFHETTMRGTVILPNRSVVQEAFPLFLVMLHIFANPNDFESSQITNQAGKKVLLMPELKGGILPRLPPYSLGGEALIREILSYTTGDKAFKDDALKKRGREIALPLFDKNDFSKWISSMPNLSSLVPDLKDLAPPVRQEEKHCALETVNASAAEHSPSSSNSRAEDLSFPYENEDAILYVTAIHDYLENIEKNQKANPAYVAEITRARNLIDTFKSRETYKNRRGKNYALEGFLCCGLGPGEEYWTTPSDRAEESNSLLSQLVKVREKLEAQKTMSQSPANASSATALSKGGKG